MNDVLEKIHKGDVGTVIELTVEEDGVAYDLSQVNTHEILFEKPDGTGVKKTATIVNAPGTDGKMQYVAEAAFFDQAGKWSMQGLLTGVGPIVQWTTTRMTFLVYEVIGVP